MKNKLYIAIIIAVILAGYNVYREYRFTQLSVLSLMNLEALTDPEYGAPCVEWASKPCHDKFYQNMNDPNGFHASCSGTPSISGGMLECGAVTGRMPMYPYENKKCLECVRTNDNSEVG
ncbi:MAG: hypothetical protein ACLS4S_10140 [Bacteroides nordii]|jgi:hypothetical protein